MPPTRLISAYSGFPIRHKVNRLQLLLFVAKKTQLFFDSLAAEDIGGHRVGCRCFSVVTVHVVVVVIVLVVLVAVVVVVVLVVVVRQREILAHRESISMSLRSLATTSRRVRQSSRLRSHASSTCALGRCDGRL